MALLLFLSISYLIASLLLSTAKIFDGVDCRLVSSHIASKSASIKNVMTLPFVKEFISLSSIIFIGGKVSEVLLIMNSL